MSETGQESYLAAARIFATLRIKFRGVVVDAAHAERWTCDGVNPKNRALEKAGFKFGCK
jgi:hypothetical protein